MRIGVAIPCYKYHIPSLKRCLDSIERQTYKPDEVIVSCSSSIPTDIPTYNYSFPLRVIVRPERRNAAENRNLAATALTTDIVSFFDCDDEMHPQRIQILLDVFHETRPDISLHSFLEREETKQPFAQIQNPRVIPNRLRRAPSGCAILEGDYSSRIHHSQATVSKFVLSRIQFKEDIGHERREDAVFCGDVLAMPGVQSVYIADPLSKYYMEGATRS
jgi:glycosyltransferase involved in cell wall biosynthesis